MLEGNILQKENEVLKVFAIFVALVFLRGAVSTIDCTFEEKSLCNYTLNGWRRYMYSHSDPRKVKGHYLHGYYNSTLQSPTVTITQDSCLRAWCYFSMWQYMSLYYASGSRDYRSYKKLTNTTWTLLQWNIKRSSSPLTVVFRSYPFGSIDDVSLIHGRCPTIACPNGMLPCPNYEYCIWKTQLCNRVNDCPGNLDESMLMCRWDPPIKTSTTAKTTTATITTIIDSSISTSKYKDLHDRRVTQQTLVKQKTETRKYSSQDRNMTSKTSSITVEIATTDSEGLDSVITRKTSTTPYEGLDVTKFLLLVAMVVMGVILIFLCIGIFKLFRSVSELQKKANESKYGCSTQLCSKNSCSKKHVEFNIYEPIRGRDDPTS